MVPGPRDIQLTAVKNLFDNFPQRSGVGVSGIDFFEVPGVAGAAHRRDIVILRSLSIALNLLASPTFADAFNGSTSQSDYRWGRLHRAVLAHPLGAPFSIPLAGGAFPQPLPNLPGISIDGGLHTVDLGTLISLAVFAAQHGMNWINLGLLPGHNSSKGSAADLNRFGGFLGAMAQSNVDEGPEVAPPRSDRETAFQLGRRVAEAARRWQHNAEALASVAR